MAATRARRAEVCILWSCSGVVGWIEGIWGKFGDGVLEENRMAGSECL